jgi:hypothetical protein
MANLAITFDGEVGKTYRLFPAPRYNLSLADWATYKKDATQQASPNTGKYDVTVDDTYRYYRVFDGETPASWALWELEIDIYNGAIRADDFSDSALAKINQHRRS